MNIVTRGYGGTPSDVILRGFGRTSAVVVNTVASQDAGRKRRTLNIYRVKVDGTAYEFRSLEDAIAFLERAKKAAATVAREAMRRATEMPSERVALEPPKFEINTRELRVAARETRDEIDRIYRQANIDAEIAMLFAFDRIKIEDDENILLLI